MRRTHAIALVFALAAGLLSACGGGPDRDDIDELRAQVPEVDAELLSRYLRSVRAICDGDESAGPVALTPPSERFHWLTAPRSDVIQASPIHEGVCFDPERELDALFRTYVHRASL